MDGDGSDDDFSLNPGESDEAALRAALHFHVGEICSAEAEGKPMTSAAVSTLAEVVFKYTEALALDLRVFAKHGKRAVVGVDDVKCVARKDPKMVEKLAGFEAANLGKKKAARKKKQPAAGELSKGATGANEDGGSGSSSDTRKESPTMIGAQDRPPPLGGDPAKDNFVDLLDDDADESPRGGSGGGGDGTGGGGGDGTDEEFDELLL